MTKHLSDLQIGRIQGEFAARKVGTVGALARGRRVSWATIHKALCRKDDDVRGVRKTPAQPSGPAARPLWPSPRRQCWLTGETSPYIARRRAFRRRSLQPCTLPKVQSCGTSTLVAWSAESVAGFQHVTLPCSPRGLFSPGGGPSPSVRKRSSFAFGAMSTPSA